ncbi:NAD(P)/FAD-dependent oxidoreductase [Streptomyces sp. NA04227]|uniref:flavin-containing monooxygenase n=1 Tax=Streptomyces sp. NA04227 TaxID=2742136 RepID=UPI00159258FF|nr:NAD(P)/FAD-dependent oxidoreductase [Streptomyces sp. NA04227]QKW07173.1 NAD(P)/FAD-dependent oxidoreductase [Streptomyces sp. NA04227]
MPHSSHHGQLPHSRLPQDQPPRRTEDHPVYVIGGGPGGLAVARELRGRGVRAVVLERAESVGGSWRRHYDRLRLHTSRRASSLPGLPIPRRFGRWVGRDDMVRYLEKYAEHHELEVVTSVEVSRIERTEDGEGWLLHASGGRRLTGSAVVVAAGYSHTPHLPDWAGSESYTGELLHAAHYRDPRPYRDRDVLVVGAGNTGADIAVDLAEGGAAQVRLAVRGAPYLVRRSVLGVPVHRAGIVLRRLPAPLVRWLTRVGVRVAVQDLTAYGLPRPDAGISARAPLGTLPVLGTGLVRAVRKRKVVPVAAVEAFEGDKVLLADGSRLAPEVVIAATGYRPGLQPLVGHLDVLDERGLPRVRGARSPRHAPGLFFTGYTNPISGMLRELALDARKIAKKIAKQAARHR